MKDAPPELIADVTLYASDGGGRKGPTSSEWYGCPCMVSKDRLVGWDCRILLRGTPLSPGETRRLGMVFLSPDKAVPILREARKFYLWEGGFVGEAVVIEEGKI